MARQTAPLPGEEPWIPEPEAGDLLWPRRTIYGGEAKWTPYRGSHRPCDLCVEVLHDHDTQPYSRHPPHPSPATLKRKGPNGESFLCARHGQDYGVRDEAIGRRLAEQRAHQAHMARSR